MTSAKAGNSASSKPRYEDFVRRFDVIRRSRLPQTDRDAFVLRTDVMYSFRQFPLLDPKLPDELMEQAMLRGQAVRLFHELWDGLSGQARRHVAHLASGAVPEEGGAG
jgi:phenylacetic acid degradation operon negative regulatory protein